MTGLLIALALLLALAAMALRRAARWRRRLALRGAPGSSPDRSIRVRSFDEIDAVLGQRVCPCGRRFALAGEGTRVQDGRRYRVSRLTCERCDVEQQVFFDTTELLH
jgi:hypothetical protein